MGWFDDLGGWLNQNGGWLAPTIGAGLGAAGANTPTKTVNSMPPEFQKLAEGVGQRGLDIGNMPYTPYDQNRTAGFSPYQFAGFDMIANQAQNNPLPGQAAGALGNLFQSGGNMMGQSANPYMGATTSGGSNPWEGKTTSVGSNPYSGSNPYLEKNIQNTMGDMARTYNQSVAPTMAATAYKSGSFGNTGQQEMENQSRSMLQQNMGRVSGDMRMQDYGMQQGLAESDIARRMNAQQTDLARSGSYAEGGLNRSLQGQMADLSRNAGLFESGANRAQNAFDSAQGRLMSGMSMAPSIYNMAYMGGNQMLGIGGTMQQQGQNVMNNQYQDFQNAQAWPFKTYDAMRAPFGGVNPGGSTTQPGGSAAAGLLGGAMLGNQLWNGYQQPKP